MVLLRVASSNAHRATAAYSTARRATAAPIVFFALLIFACWTSSATAATPGFTEVAAQVGLTFTHNHLLDTPGGEMLGGGTVGDFNGDGWPDLYIIDGGLAPDRLFINHGGVFVDEAAAWGLTDLHRGSGAAAADYDGDGDVDLMVTTFGNMPGSPAPCAHKLYRNDGGHFTNVAAEAGVECVSTDHADGFSPAFGDYDLDGDLDLWVGGWFEDAHESSAAVRWTSTRLFRNEGDGTFVDVTKETGVYDARVRGFSAIFADMDGDRYPELLVAADFGTSRYFHNNRDGTFTRHLFGDWNAVTNGMGTAIADFNRDGWLDWFVTSIYPAYHFLGPPGNRLWLNKGGKKLQMVPESLGLNDGGWGWGATAFDFDQDGWVDLFHTDGWREKDVITGESFIDEQKYLYHNNGDGTFTEMALTLGIEDRQQGRGVATLDFDHDGDLDLLHLTSGGVLHLYRNDITGDDAHWLQVRLGRGNNPHIAPDGRGSTVRITTPDGVRQMAQMTGHANYLSGNEPLIHFGLGAANVVSKVTIDWADGSSTVLHDVAADQVLEITAP